MSEVKVTTDIITLTRHVLEEQRKHKEAKPLYERALQIDMVRFDRAVPTAGRVGS